jgi:hypothetical protein
MESALHRARQLDDEGPPRKRPRTDDPWVKRIDDWCEISNIVCRRWGNFTYESVWTRSFVKRDAPLNSFCSRLFICDQHPDCTERTVNGETECVHKKQDLQYLDAGELSNHFVSRAGVPFRILYGPIDFDHKKNVYFKTDAKTIQPRDFSTLGLNLHLPYVYIVEIRETVFVLCNCGQVLNMERFVQHEAAWFSSIFKRVADMLRGSDVDLVIAGHSMGSMVAVRLGNYIMTHDPEFFQKHCCVLGSGLFRCIQKHEPIATADRDKVKIFAATVTSKTGEVYIDHSFVQTFNPQFELFPSVVRLLISDKSVQTQPIATDALLGMVPKPDQNILHDLETYVTSFAILHKGYDDYNDNMRKLMQYTKQLS